MKLWLKKQTLLLLPPLLLILKPLKLSSYAY
jgi:hypothetical protein